MSLVSILLGENIAAPKWVRKNSHLVPKEAYKVILGPKPRTDPRRVLAIGSVKEDLLLDHFYRFEDYARSYGLEGTTTPQVCIFAEHIVKTFFNMGPKHEGEPPTLPAIVFVGQYCKCNFFLPGVEDTMRTLETHPQVILGNVPLNLVKALCEHFKVPLVSFNRKGELKSISGQ